jgi:tripartite-type tricarboxylate transporter receptor subunit TctC
MRAFLLCLLLAPPLFAPILAAAQYPSKPVRMIVTYPPGGGADTIARLLAPRVGEALRQPLIVENRPGASGTIGAGEVARAAPDGMTLMLDASSYAVNPSLYAKLPYDPRRAFAPISLLVLFPNMLVVNPAFPARSVQELVAAAKAQPGKIAYASSGNGSAQHLAAELFRQGAGLDMVHVPYKGGGPALQDVIGGQVPVFFANMASGLPHVKSGRLRALAVTGTKRSNAAPELPTVAESGVPGYEVYEWNAVFAPAGTPAPIVQRLHAEFAKALAAPDVRERIAGLGGEIAATPPADTERWLADQFDKWARVVRTSNIKID